MPWPAAECGLGPRSFVAGGSPVEPPSAAAACSRPGRRGLPHRSTVPVGCGASLPELRHAAPRSALPQPCSVVVGQGSFCAARLSPTAPGFPISVGQLLASNTTTTRGRAPAPCRVAIGRANTAWRVGTIQLRTSQPRCPPRAPPFDMTESVGFAPSSEQEAWPGGVVRIGASGPVGVRVACCSAGLGGGASQGYTPSRRRPRPTRSRWLRLGAVWVLLSVRR